MEIEQNPTYNALYKDGHFAKIKLGKMINRGGAAGKIYDNTFALLNICEQNISEKLLSSAPFIEFIHENYCNPDFSITMMSEKFHASDAYMSYRFKKELNTTFSDYLWELRFKKAKELLDTTTMSIEEISVAVGYINSNSFRRKFKQETGISPSQYRFQSDD